MWARVISLGEFNCWFDDNKAGCLLLWRLSAEPPSALLSSGSVSPDRSADLPQPAARHQRPGTEGRSPGGRRGPNAVDESPALERGILDAYARLTRPCFAFIAFFLSRRAVSITAVLSRCHSSRESRCERSNCASRGLLAGSASSRDHFFFTLCSNPLADTTAWPPKTLSPSDFSAGTSSRYTPSF